MNPQKYPIISNQIVRTLSSIETGKLYFVSAQLDCLCPISNPEDLDKIGSHYAISVDTETKVATVVPVQEAVA